jgi:hypothetical protein
MHYATNQTLYKKIVKLKSVHFICPIPDWLLITVPQIQGRNSSSVGGGRVKHAWPVITYPSKGGRGESTHTHVVRRLPQALGFPPLALFLCRCSQQD